MILRAFLLFSCLLAISLGAAPLLKVDVSMDTGRNDTAAEGWVEWQVKDGRTASRQFGTVRVELRAIGTEPLKGTWYKRGLATGAVMATDGVRASQIQLRITGLEPGNHSIATWHNVPDKTPFGMLALRPNGQEPLLIESSHRCEKDVDAAVAYLTFKADANGVAEINIVNAGEGAVILNGFELDGSNPLLKATSPYPEFNNWHVDGDSGEVRLEWMAPESAQSHRVYFVRADSIKAAREALLSEKPDDNLHVASVADPVHTVKVDAYNSQVFYAWRVDTVDAAGDVTMGDVWLFRVRQIAFPGAEGYGRFAVGGRGGRVLKVTHLGDSGPGSFRAAVEAEGPRTIVFDVSGRIHLEKRLVIRNPFVTIAGHTAPGKGICISNFNLGMMGTHDVIVRHLRVRPGDTSGMTLDGMGMASSDHCIIDHCSISWTQDEAFSSRGAKNITLQRSLISEALNIAGHKKYKEGTQHGYAASISGDVGSFHYNLLAHCAGRNWSLAGGLDKAGVHCGRLDIRNNVVYNWSHRTTDGGAMEVNFVNNYYKPGPASRVFHVLKPERNPGFGPQSYYVEGNIMEGHYGADETLDGVVRVGKERLSDYIVEEPFFPSYVSTVSAEDAYTSVLLDVGANLPVQDEHDKRVIRETLSGTVTYAGSISGLPGLPDSQSDVGGWEVYPMVKRPENWDIDGDGIPGLWEVRFGLDPADPADGSREAQASGYTYLETYLHWLAAGNRPESLLSQPHSSQL
jgi:hypothetical protein